MAPKRSNGRSARKTTGGGARRAPRNPDAIRLLKDDHQTVSQLFDRFEKARGESQKEKLAAEICTELKIHAQIEEEIFYPAVREAIDDAELMNEAEIEHASAKDLIVQIEGASASDERYDALVTVLAEYIRHHVKEEEGEMFKKVRASELDLVDLAERMTKRKTALKGSPPKRAKSRLGAIIGATATA